MRDPDDTPKPAEDDAREELWNRRAFSPEVVERAREKTRREEAERRRRLFGDREPFAIPEDDIDV